MRTWLLRRFGVSEPLIGDIEEERRAGRSWLWLCRQSVVAIVIANARAVRSHPVLTLRAVATGWLAIYAASLPLTYLVRFLGPMTWMSRGWFLALPWIMSGATVLMLLIVGWCVARLHRGHEAAGVLAFAATMVLTVLVMSLIYGAPFARLPRVLLFILPVLAGGLARRPRTTLPPEATPPVLHR